MVAFIALVIILGIIIIPLMPSISRLFTRAVKRYDDDINKKN